MRDRISECEASHGAEAGVPIERIAKSHIRKETASQKCSRNVVAAGHGSLRELSAVARQSDRQELRAAG